MYVPAAGRLGRAPSRRPRGYINPKTSATSATNINILLFYIGLASSRMHFWHPRHIRDIRDSSASAAFSGRHGDDNLARSTSGMWRV